MVWVILFFLSVHLLNFFLLFSREYWIPGVNLPVYLIHFWPMFPFYTSWKHHKTEGFLVFSGDIKWEHWPERYMKTNSGNSKLYFLIVWIENNDKPRFSQKISCFEKTSLFFVLYIVILCRISRLEVFCKNGVLRNLTKFTGKHLCQGLF